MIYVTQTFQVETFYRTKTPPRDPTIPLCVDPCGPVWTRAWFPSPPDSVALIFCQHW